MNSAELETVTQVIYDEIGVLVGVRALSERTAKKVLAALEVFGLEDHQPLVGIGNQGEAILRAPQAQAEEALGGEEPLTEEQYRTGRRIVQARKRAEKLPKIETLVKTPKRGSVVPLDPELGDPRRFHNMVANDPRNDERNEYIIARDKQGVPMRQIAQEIGVSRQRIDQLARILGINHGKPGLTKPGPKATPKAKPVTMAQAATHAAEVIQDGFSRALGAREVVVDAATNGQRYNRDEYVKMRRESGWTMQQIADDLQLSRQRVAQILADIDVVTSPVTEVKRARRQKLVDKLRAMANANPKTTREEAFKEVGVADADRGPIIDMLRNQGIKFAPSGPHGPAKGTKKFEDRDLWKAMRKVKDELGLGYLTSAAYEKHRDRKTDPSLSLILLRTRTWKEACKRARIKAGTGGRKLYERVYSEADFEAAMTQFCEYAQNTGISPTVYDYESWRKQQEHAPSLSYVRRVAKEPWRDVVEKYWPKAA